MRKSILITASVLFFGLTANAQTDTTQKTTTSTTVQTQQIKEYVSIDRNTVSPEALEKIGTKYGGYSLLEANRSTDGEYKLLVSKDGKNTTAYFSSTGEFIREE